MKTKLLWKGINAAAAAGKLTKESVLSAVNMEFRSYNSAREEEFLLLTSLSIKVPFVRSLKILDCEIKFLKGSFPRKFRARDQFDSDWGRISKEKHTPDDHVKVIVKTKAKQLSKAVNKSLRALDMVRALKCLLVNYQASYTFGPTHFAPPINRVMLGGLHSLHNPDGSLAADYFWYDIGYQAKPAVLLKATEHETYTNHFRWALKSLRKLPYDYKVADSLVRYVRAFDEKDRNMVLFKAWGALESLAAPGENAYEPVIRRCSFLFVDPEYHRQILEHLREYRNLSTHVGEYVDDATVHCYQSQYYFSTLVFWHIRNAGRYQLLEEANNFLDLPNDAAILHAKLKELRRALRFVNPRPITSGVSGS